MSGGVKRSPDVAVSGSPEQNQGLRREDVRYSAPPGGASVAQLHGRDRPAWPRHGTVSEEEIRRNVKSQAHETRQESQDGATFTANGSEYY